MRKIKQISKKIIALLKKASENIQSFLMGLCRYSGLELVYRKFVPNDDKLPSGPLWLIGIYVAAFGLSEQLYENRIGIIENRTNTVLKMIGTKKRTFALSLLPSVLSMKAPVRPEFWNPISVTKSLMAECSLPKEKQNKIKIIGKEFFEFLNSFCQPNKEIGEILKIVIMSEKSNLEGVKWNGINLSGYDLSNANFKDAELQEANLSKADLSLVDLSGANLTEAALNEANFYKEENVENFYKKEEEISKNLYIYEEENEEESMNRYPRAKLIGTIFAKAKLVGAILTDADLTDADLTNADLTNADLTNAILLKGKFTVATAVNANFSNSQICTETIDGNKSSFADFNGADITNAKFNSIDCYLDDQLIGARNWEKAEFDESVYKELDGVPLDIGFEPVQEALVLPDEVTSKLDKIDNLLVAPAAEPLQEARVLPDFKAEAPLMMDMTENLFVVPPVELLQEARVIPDFKDEQPLEDIFFEYKDYTLTDVTRISLGRNARWLQKNPEIKVELQGHLDERGSNNSNLARSETMAWKVKSYLVLIGVKEDRLYTIGYGEEKPFCFESNEACWYENRRVHFEIVKP